jgi:hypothetical protein
MKEIKVRATREAILEFQDSIIWADITRELKAWKKGFNHEMLNIVDDAEAENPSTASVLLHMGDLNGRQKAVDYVLNILNMFLGILESDKPEVSDE